MKEGKTQREEIGGEGRKYTKRGDRRRRKEGVKRRR